MARILLLCAWAAVAGAQPYDLRFEAGVQIGVLDERKALDEKPLIAGGRFAARLLRVLDADAEVNRFPIGGGFSAFPGTQVLIGAKAGYRVGPFGIFAKVRPGFIRFDRPPFRRTPELGTRPVVDLGGVLEIYSSYHAFVRIDYSDVVVSYGNSAFGTRHQLQASFGMGVWF